MRDAIVRLVCGVLASRPEIAAVEKDLPRPARRGRRRADDEGFLYEGYEPKLSFERRVIWERPDTRLYYSEEAALHLLDTK
jgi:hypothetical protein